MKPPLCPALRSFVDRRSSAFIGGALRFSELAHDQVAESGVRNGVHGQLPVRFVCEAAAFYSILFGHHDRVRVPESNVARGERMMVGKSVRREVESHALQVAE